MLQEHPPKISDWERIAPALQFSLSAEALKRARLIIGAQAQMLSDQMDRGALPSFDGPDALRLLAMILGQEYGAVAHHRDEVVIPSMA